jgi:hypothetical protein
MASPAPDDYARTRRALHAVAEQVLSAALYRATGHIGLRPTEGGFGTPAFPVDGLTGRGQRTRRLRVDGLDLVVVDDGDERRAPLRTVADAAAFVDVDPGAPDVYPAATPVEPEAPLDLDPASAAVVHHWLHVTGRALDTLCQRVGSPEPPVAQLWPEHFDLAVSIAEVNYGGSPGDDDHAAPYAYVGPWDRSDLADAFWNEPFGASRPHDELPSTDLVVAFFEEGQARAAARRPAP